MKKINLTTYTSSTKSFYTFKNDLYTSLEKDIFSPSKISLCFHTLKCIDFDFKHRPGIPEEDVVKGCETVKQLFFKQFGVWEEKIVTIKSPTIFEQFLYNLLDLEKLPSTELAQLEDKVKEDLETRNKTIQFYLSFKYISEYLTECIAPRNHDEKTLHSFYVRNIHEQQKIVQHLLIGVKTRAIIRAKTSFYDPFYSFNPYLDRPYTTAIPGAEKYFDHTKIELVGHRLGPLLIKDGNELKRLYKEDKDEFYKKLELLFPTTTAIKQIEYYLTLLNPLTQARKDLFSELIELFTAEKWYGFYSLALSQIEGLFSEMLEKINPKLKKATLLDKVRALRPAYTYSDTDFDYYEYYIPVQRNKFMHSGIDVGIKDKSHDLLYDLLHILTIYTSLEAPIVKLNHILKAKDPDKFLNEEGFNEYFELIEKSKPDSDFKSMEKENEEFEKEFLCGYIDLDHFTTELETLIPQNISHLINTIKLYTKYGSEGEFNLDFWTNHTIKTKTETLVKELSGVWNGYSEIFLKTESYRYFLDKFEVYLPHAPIAIKNRLIAIKTLNKSNFEKVKLIVEEMRKKDL